jgi:hypothetical protein
MRNNTAHIVAALATLLMVAVPAAQAVDPFAEHPFAEHPFAEHPFAEHPFASTGTRRFDGATVAEVVRTFNRRNTIQLVVTDPAIARRRIGGTFNLEHPEQFAAALEKLLGVKMVREGDTIRLEVSNARR